VDGDVAKDGGQDDSDDDEDQRIVNMLDPDKKRFNVNDILGRFDQDEKGNPLILQDKTGAFVDKEGNRVNQKGYLIDEETGDVVEKENGKKIFDFLDLDERGELPPPFNLERFNFNVHDVRGYFDRDADGNEVLGAKKDASGNLVDKLGRLVNAEGYLVDRQGNLVDKRGRVKLHSNIMKKSKGAVPQMFNYKGRRFDIKEVTGDLDKDRAGNMIIRRDKDNNMVDKKGRRVNNKGYLVDDSGNVVNKEGKLMFEKYCLSKDNEIPKLFPFLKFNVEDIKGDFEYDPVGNPMLHRAKNGLVDDKGRRVNEKGYLLDDNGNVKNKKGFRVFDKRLLEDDGDIPTIFREGLLRKDTQDSYAQLMDEIEDLEKVQDLDPNDPRRIKTINRQTIGEFEKLQKKIEQIAEEEDDDDQHRDDDIDKELRELAGDSISEGGNTSVDSLMEDTPSNYNAANQRFNEIEQLKNRALKGIKKQR